MRKLQLLALFFLICGCAAVSQDQTTQTKTNNILPIRTMHNPDNPMIFNVITGKYQGNYRIKFIMDHPDKAVFETSGNYMYMKLDPRTAFLPEPANRLQQQDSPCKYQNSGYQDNKLVITFLCAENTKIYHEVVGLDILDLIISQ